MQGEDHGGTGAGADAALAAGLAKALELVAGAVAGFAVTRMVPGPRVWHSFCGVPRAGQLLPVGCFGRVRDVMGIRTICAGGSSVAQSASHRMRRDLAVRKTGRRWDGLGARTHIPLSIYGTRSLGAENETIMRRRWPVCAGAFSEHWTRSRSAENETIMRREWPECAGAFSAHWTRSRGAENETIMRRVWPECAGAFSAHWTRFLGAENETAMRRARPECAGAFSAHWTRSLGAENETAMRRAWPEARRCILGALDAISRCRE